MKKMCLVLIVIMSAGSLAAFDYSENHNEYEITNFDISLYNSNFFELAIGLQEFELILNPEMSFSKYSITSYDESVFFCDLSPYVVIADRSFGFTTLFDIGLYDFDLDMDIYYQKDYFFNPEADTPIGISSHFELWNLTLVDSMVIDFEAIASLYFLSGRLYDQKFVVRAKNLVDNLQIQVSDKELENIAQYLAEKAHLFYSISDKNEKAFITGLSELLGLRGDEYRVFQAFRAVSGVYRNMLYGNNFNAGIDMNYSYVSNSLLISSTPEIYRAWNEGDELWYTSRLSLYIPIIYYGLNNGYFSALPLYDTNLNWRYTISWYPHSDMALRFTSICVWDDVTSIDLFFQNTYAFTQLSAEIALTDSLTMEIDIPFRDQISETGINLGVNLNLELL